MGKTPETLDGKLLKVRENKRRTAAKQNAKVSKLWQHGTYLLLDNATRRTITLPEKRGGGLTLAEAEKLLADRRSRTPADDVVVAGP
jgi:hypothetical protein